MKKIIIIAAVLCVAVLACSLALQSKNEKTAAPLSAAAPLAQSSAKSADKPKDKAAGAIIHIAEPGDVITLGSFPQTGFFNRKQPLRWRVLETFYTDKALIIAENAVECMPFQAEPKEQSSWQDSDIRKWLNGEFFNNAFSPEEKQSIVTTQLNISYKRRSDNAITGYTVRDKVFLLSGEEADKYFKDNADRMCSPTNHAVKNGVWKSKDNSCWWWLRSSQKGEGPAVDAGGFIHFESAQHNIKNYAVRPAMVVQMQ